MLRALPNVNASKPNSSAYYATLLCYPVLFALRARVYIELIRERGPLTPPGNPAGARMKAGVVRSKREHGTRTEQSFYWSRRELAHIEIRKENQFELDGGRLHVFSKLVLKP